MTILVTGSGGFLGKQISRSLLSMGALDLRLHVRNQPPVGFIEQLRSEYPQAKIESAAANLLARGRYAQMFDAVDTLVHAAAGMRGAAADMFANTVVASRNVFEAAGQAGVRRVVLISSFAVYQTVHLRRGDSLDEHTLLEAVGVEKGPYGYAKTRQEQLLQELQQHYGFETVILRPGVIYGPGGGALSPRVGLKVMGVFLSLGNRATLPLTYVENCGDAVACAALHAPAGSSFSVVDDDLPTCKEYLRGYRREVEKLRVIPVPFAVLLWGARRLVNYHRRSSGQLPAVFTPYMVRSMYTPLIYSNRALKQIGWTQRVPTADGLQHTFAWLRGNRR